MEPHSFLLETRLCTPQLRADAVPRLALLKKLDATRKLTMLVAPAGFGKTTLVLQWLKQQNAPVAWLSLEESDIDLPLFLLYLIAAIQKLDPEFGTQTTFALQELQERHLHPLLTPLLNDFQRWEEPIIVVLDDVHHLQDPVIHQALSFLLQHLPKHVHLIVMSREMPAFSLARLRARGELQLLHTHDLRFSPSQSATFFRETMGLQLSQTHVQDLHKRAEGWATGLQLTGLSLQYQSHAPHVPGEEQALERNANDSNLPESEANHLKARFSGRDQYIDDFLMTEVFAHQPEDIQRFLLHSSVLAQLSGERCNWLLEREDSASLLSTLESRQLFVTRIDATNPSPWYRYHGLFRDWLQHRLELEEPGKTAELHKRAALRSQTHGSPSETVRHWLAAGCYTEAALYLEAQAARFFRERAQTLLGQWIEALPETILQQHPQLIAHQVLLLFHQRSDVSNHMRLKKALHTLAVYDKEQEKLGPKEAASPEASLLTNTLALGRAIGLRIRGDLQASADLAEQTLDLFPEEYSVFASHAAVMVHTSRIRERGIEATRAEQIQASMEACEQGSDFHGWMLFSSLLHYVYLLQGALTQAIHVYQKAEQVLALRWPHALEARASTQAYVGVGEIYYQRNQLTKAEHVLAKALLATRQRGNTRTAYSARVALGFVKYAEGKPEEAASLIAGLAPPPPHSPGHLQWSYARSLQLSLALGDHTRLLTWQQHRQHQLDAPITFDNYAEYLVLVRWLLAQDQPAQAQPFLTSLQRACRSQGFLAPLAEATMLEALLRQQQGALSDACQHLLTALQMTQPEGNARLFLDAGAPMATLLAKCQRFLPKKVLQPHATWLQLLLDGFSRATPKDDLPKLERASDGAEGLVEETKAHESPSTTAPKDLYFLDPLSTRESEILMLIAEGLTNNELAQRLHIALSTTKKHARNIYSKLGVRNRTEAVKRARDLGITT